MKKLVIASSDLPEEQIRILEKNFEVILVDRADENHMTKYEAYLPRAHGIIGFGLPLTQGHLNQATLLEAVATVSVGYDRFDVKALSARKIALTNTPDVLTETTADLGFTLMLASARRLIELSDQVRQGNWKKGAPDLHGVDIYGKTLGVVGFGRIGQAIARRGHFGFGMPVLYYNRSEKVEAKEMSAKFVNLETLCRESDFICVVIPLSAETKNLIGAREFNQMKKSSVFVNIARGDVVDETALYEALADVKIFSAGLDVFQVEPLPTTSPLLKLKNVIL